MTTRLKDIADRNSEAQRTINRLLAALDGGCPCAGSAMRATREQHGTIGDTRTVSAEEEAAMDDINQCETDV